MDFDLKSYSNFIDTLNCNYILTDESSKIKALNKKFCLSFKINDKSTLIDCSLDNLIENVNTINFIESEKTHVSDIKINDECKSVSIKCDAHIKFGEQNYKLYQINLKINNKVQEKETSKYYNLFNHAPLIMLQLQ